ncbi:MAG: 3-dehydroquinate synthase II [Thermoplasmata archaeon]
MTADRILLWIRAEAAPHREEILHRARRRGFTRFVAEDGSPRTGEEWWRSDDAGFRAMGPGPAREIPIRRVSDPDALRDAAAELRSGRPIAIRWEGERVLPLETLVAERGARAGLWVVTGRAEEVPGLLGALQHGPEAVVVEIRSPEEVDRTEEMLESPLEPTGAWTTVRLSRVEPAGLGDRVLVDTTSLLGPEEGMLVGSSAALLFLVASEAAGSRYTRPRPFRVNAGAAHSYLLLASGETRYLSELVSGEAVLAAHAPGSVRSVRVGRLKIERRPLLRLEAEDGEARPTLFVQEAETVRLITPDGPRAVTELARDDALLARRLPPARHLGIAVDESLRER